MERSGVFQLYVFYVVIVYMFYHRKYDAICFIFSLSQRKKDPLDWDFGGKRVRVRRRRKRKRGSKKMPRQIVEIDEISDKYHRRQYTHTLNQIHK